MRKTRQIAARFKIADAEVIAARARASCRTVTDEMRYLVFLGLGLQEVKIACLQRAADFAREAAAYGQTQARVVANPQLAKLKGEHWRIVAKALEAAEIEARK